MTQKIWHVTIKNFDKAHRQCFFHVFGFIDIFPGSLNFRYAHTKLFSHKRRFCGFQILSFFSSKKNGYSTEASFETKPFRLHKLDSGPSNKVSVGREEALEIYKKLHTVRRMETAAGNLYKEKIVRGFCHLYSGQVSPFASKTKNPHAVKFPLLRNQFPA